MTRSADGTEGTVMTIDEAIERAREMSPCQWRALPTDLYCGRYASAGIHRGNGAGHHRYEPYSWLTVLIDAATANAPSKEGL